jgi:hypothetical protein
VGTEILGEFLYQNPIIFVLVWVAVIYGLRNHTQFIEKRKFHLLLFQAIPMISVFIFFSLFRRTLPHWTGPAYISLILVGAAFLSRKNRKRIFNYPPALSASVILLTLVLLLGYSEIKYGVLNTGAFLKKDVTLDMYGWNQLRKEFEPIKIKAEKEKVIQENAPIISPRWFPAAHLDYYVAKRTNTYVMGWGSLERIHKYAWMNENRGGYKKGMDVWYITMDSDFMNPWMGEKYFENSIAYDTIEIKRSGKTVNKAYLYIFENLKKLPPNDYAEFMEKHKKKPTE